MDPDRLHAWMAEQRWYAGKGRTTAAVGIRSLATLREDAPTVRVDLVDVTYTDGGRDSYQVPLSLRSEPVEGMQHALVGQEPDGDGRWVYDALHDKEAAAAWLGALATEADVRPAAGGGSGLTFHREPDVELPDPSTPSIPIGAEQSNTSLVFGEAAVLKVFRRVAPGANPDIELHEALTAVGSPHIARPLGWVEGHWADPGHSGTLDGALAFLQEYLRLATDGWSAAVASVRDLLAEADLRADEVGGDFAAESHRLGAVTAEVHAALAQALPSRPATREDLTGAAEDMDARLEANTAAVPDLAPYADAIRDTYGAVRRLDPGTVGAPLQRIHGDYHLGQVLRTVSGWRVLDFEGEPARPLAERRALESTLRDVAGMLRSFDYASHHLLLERSGDPSLEPQLEYRATEWAERNRAAFCAGYVEAATTPDPLGPEALLRAYELDKAVYEVGYEAHNRPAWLRLPLESVRRLVGERTS